MGQVVAGGGEMKSKKSGTKVQKIRGKKLFFVAALKDKLKKKSG